ncbi:MAG: hypothetical protein EOO50_06945 [Flavobacterium sp.]|uniref:hypothetical protein n=1 Tax=Flavobacterium sp. TaxID=239 RepID=UPI00121A7C4B|nr:hypothetical protein [Flavobacterium sp.]RZJ66995.1 MAG: hypothetical protein EOO50_06945 [Flavobacterium sp.]
MKKKLILFAFLLAVTAGFSQTIESLKSRTEKMYAATSGTDFKTIMDLTYNKVFESVDKATLTSAMENMFRNEFMTISFPSQKPVFTYGPIKEIEGKKFSVIKYKSAMKMTLAQKPEAAAVQNMIDGLKSTGKYSTVTYDEATNSLNIDGDATLIAVSDASTKNEWEFVNYDSEELFAMVFNANIKKSLGL